jgi:bifunctional non-homologous end joining protein LigD
LTLALERLLALRPEGILVNPFERGETGPDLFRAPSVSHSVWNGVATKDWERKLRSGL